MLLFLSCSNKSRIFDVNNKTHSIHPNNMGHCLSQTINLTKKALKCSKSKHTVLGHDKNKRWVIFISNLFKRYNLGRTINTHGVWITYAKIKCYTIILPERRMSSLEVHRALQSKFTLHLKKIMVI